MTADDSASIAVIGAGLMGVGIAQVFAGAGMNVALYDPIAAARDSVRSRLETGCELLGLDSQELLRLISVHDKLVDACRGAALVIEAGPENVDVKKTIFAELASGTSPETILASNTSAIPIGAIAQGVLAPSRVVGTHFWNPPYLVPLVEVIQGPATSLKTVDTTLGLLREARMKPVHVKVDVPGFVGNRMQHALKREAIALVAEGVCSAETVDMVVRYGFGRRLALVGPLEQADLGGTDLTLAIHETLMPAIDATPVPHPFLVAMVERGDLGAKSGRGFFAWSPGEAERRRAEINRGLVEQLVTKVNSEQAETPDEMDGDE